MPVELSLDALALDRWIRPGDGVVWGQACAEPVVLVDALLGAGITPLSAFVGLSWRELRPPEGMRVLSNGALGRLGRLPSLEVVPCHYSALPRLFAARRLPSDVVLVQVSPPDKLGRCSMGVGQVVDADAVKALLVEERRRSVQDLPVSGHKPKLPVHLLEERFNQPIDEHWAFQHR